MGCCRQPVLGSIALPGDVSGACKTGQPPPLFTGGGNGNKKHRFPQGAPCSSESLSLCIFLCLRIDYQTRKCVHQLNWHSAHFVPPRRGASLRSPSQVMIRA